MRTRAKTRPTGFPIPMRGNEYQVDRYNADADAGSRSPISLASTGERIETPQTLGVRPRCYQISPCFGGRNNGIN